MLFFVWSFSVVEGAVLEVGTSDLPHAVTIATSKMPVGTNQLRDIIILGELGISARLGAASLLVNLIACLLGRFMKKPA